MKKIIALLAFVFTTTTFANITGNWTGWGEWTYQGSGTHCDSMKLNFEETNGLLIRHGGYFDCQVVGLSVVPGEWTKRGNNLLVDDKIVGTITDYLLHLEEEYSDDVKIVTEITYEGNHMDYVETWYNKDMIVIYEITGRLFRRNVAKH